MAWEMLRTGTSYSHDLFWYFVHENFNTVYQKKRFKLDVIFSGYYLALWGQEEIVSFLIKSNKIKELSWNDPWYEYKIQSLLGKNHSAALRLLERDNNGDHIQPMVDFCKWPNFLQKGMSI